MYRHGYISEEQLNDAKSISVASLIVENKGNTLNKYQSFIDTVANEVKKDHTFRMIFFCPQKCKRIKELVKSRKE